MKISKRTLEKWRKEALKDFYESIQITEDTAFYVYYISELQSRILHLTRVLLDQELTKKRY